MEEEKIVVFAGVDWATEEHVACVVGPNGDVLSECSVKNNAEGLETLCRWLLDLAGGRPGGAAVAIEVPHGVVVETLMDRHIPVYSINPKQLDRFRDRFTLAGAKDDSLDARVLADSLRTDRRCFRKLNPELPEVIELREWSRMVDELQHERNRLGNRVRDQLRRYYPQFLELSTDVAANWFLDLWKLVPTPEASKRFSERRAQGFLKAHRLRRLTAGALVASLCKPPVTVSPGTQAAAVAHIEQLADRLSIVNRQLKSCETRIEELCDALTAANDDGAGDGSSPPELPDTTILRSLPGVGRVVLGVLLGEAWWAIKARDYAALRSLCGVAPITRRSGKSKIVVMRQACSPRLRDALYHWSRVAIQHDEISRAKYSTLRTRGHSHGRALRSVGDRLLAVACAMLRSHTVFDSGRRSAAMAVAAN